MASTAIITDIGSVITNGPSTLTKAASIAAAGPIMDYVGMSELAKLKAEELKVLIAQLFANTSAGDDSTNRTLLSGIADSLD